MPKAEFASSNPRALIRRARLSDATQIGRLLHQLGYPISARFVHRKLTVLLNDEKEDLLVAERDDTRVIGFLAMHCIPQIGVEGGFARISYLCVDKETRLKGVGKKLEREACRLAAEEGATESNYIATLGEPKPTAFTRAKATPNRPSISSRAFAVKRRL